MPKTPGRRETRPKWPIEKLVIASFFMPWETKYAKRVCFVEDCDHRIGQCMVANRQPGIAVDEAQYDRDIADGTMLARSGPVCECCTDKILSRK